MINFIYSNEGFREKPTGAVVAALQKPSAYTFSESSVEEIAALISSGKAWRAGIYDEATVSFKKANVKGAFILALDFDQCAAEPQEIIDYAQSIGITPSLWYYSYSQGKKGGNNFRVLWVLEEQIKPIQYENIYKSMLNAFADYKPDAATKDCSRLWFGTRQRAEIVNEKPIPLSVIGWLGVCDKVREGQQPQKAKKSVKGCENKFFEVETNSEPFEITQGTKWDNKLNGRCWLWDRWRNGIYLNYNQRLTLFSNLKFLKSTDRNHSIVSDVLEIYEKHKDVYAGHTCNEAQIRSMFLNTTLHDIGIVLVNEEEDLITVREYFKKYGDIEPVKNTIQKIPQSELEEMMNTEIPRLLNENGIWYIKSQTASGKTHRVINWILEQDLTEKKIIYAAPRHINVEEFAERFYAAQAAAGQEKGSNVWVIPKGKYTAYDELLMNLGFPAKTRNEERYNAIKKLLNPDEKGLFVATHQLILNLRECPAADCVIIDENIEDALLDAVILDKNDLGGLIGYIKDKDKKQNLFDFIDVIDEMERGEAVDITCLREALDKYCFDWDDYIMSRAPARGIAKVLNTDIEQPRITKKTGARGNDFNAIRFTTKSRLISSAIEQNIPIKLLSATPKSARLSSLYATDLIKTYEFPLAKNEGQIIQFQGMTGAKGQNCSKIDKLIEYVSKCVPEKEKENAYVLSFKDSIAQWRDAGYKVPTYNGTDLHLANSAGLDLLKGKIVIVAGKFDRNNDEYIDIYYDIHPDAKQPPKRQNQTLTINGITKTLYLWEDDVLRDLQIEHINMYLEQAAGRARALREKGAKVYLFSNFSIADADILYD